MKEIAFLGISLKAIREFPEEARREAGFQLDRVQRGMRPSDAKAMPSIGKGVAEIRLWDEAGTFRVIYTAKLAGVVYVLHAFQKKTQYGTAGYRESEGSLRGAGGEFAELIGRWGAR